MGIIGIILGWLNPFNWIKIFFNYINRPKLEIFYDAKETYHQARDLAFNGVMGLFCHVMVKNIGKKTAINCIGELKNIEVFKNGRFHTVSEYRNIMQLKWAHEKNFSPKDIDPNELKRLDVCYVHKGFDYIHFFTEKYPSGNQTDFPPGKYKIKIKVKSNNTSSTENNFIIQYKKGEFESLKIKNSN